MSHHCPPLALVGPALGEGVAEVEGEEEEVVLLGEEGLTWVGLQARGRG